MEVCYEKERESSGWCGRCLSAVIAGVGVVWVTFNESRLVEPMELSEYEFTVKDLPMIVSVILMTLYAIVLIVLTTVSNKKKSITRKINPKLGF